jgi:hypothetical protein
MNQSAGEILDHVHRLAEKDKEVTAGEVVVRLAAAAMGHFCLFLP